MIPLGWFSAAIQDTVKNLAAAPFLQIPAPNEHGLFQRYAVPAAVVQAPHVSHLCTANLACLLHQHLGRAGCSNDANLTSTSHLRSYGVA